METHCESDTTQPPRTPPVDRRPSSSRRPKVHQKQMTTEAAAKKQKVNHETEEDVNAKQPCRYVITTADGLEPSSQSLRCATPYLYDFQTYTKGRWVKRRIIDVFVNEFGGNDEEYYRRAISLGLILVNGAATSCDYELVPCDRIVHRMHMHEPPVIYQPAAEMIIFEDEDLLATNKPASIPVHPCGAYRENSLLSILQREYLSEESSIKPVHRLDRLTSGVVLFAKHTKMANQLMSVLAGKGARDDLSSVRKLYLAKVHGRFLSSKDQGEELCRKRATESESGWKTASLDHVPEAERYSKTIGDQQRGLFFTAHNPESAFGNQLQEHFPSAAKVDVYFSWPLECTSKKLGRWNCVGETRLRQADSGCKEALSRFRLLHYDEANDYSIVESEPLTGRTHQLRVHLQFLGFAITNDPNYGIHGNLNDKRKKDSETKKKPPQIDIEQLEAKSDIEKAQGICRYCQQGGAEAAFNSTQLRWRGIHLHSLCYELQLKGKHYRFLTPLPDFAKQRHAPEQE